LTRERELPPPLEMTCLNALWEIHEGNVEDVRKVVSQNRPLAYTTVLTLLDRLARRGAVARRKEGRGFRYQPVVARDKLRRLALRQFLEYHFDGSEAKLKIFLEQPVESPLPDSLFIASEQPGAGALEPAGGEPAEDGAAETRMAAFAAAAAAGREPHE
jgi:predicted transcriptional regulator